MSFSKKTESLLTLIVECEYDDDDDGGGGVKSAIDSRAISTADFCTGEKKEVIKLFWRTKGGLLLFLDLQSGVSEEDLVIGADRDRNNGRTDEDSDTAEADDVDGGSFFGGSGYLSCVLGSISL